MAASRILALSFLVALICAQAGADPCIPYVNTTYLPPVAGVNVFDVWEEAPTAPDDFTYTWHVRLNDYYWQSEDLYTWDSFAFVVYDGIAELQRSSTSLATWYQVKNPGNGKEPWYPVAEWRGTTEPNIVGLPQSEFSWTPSGSDRNRGWSTFTGTFDKTLGTGRSFAMHLRWNNQARSLTEAPYTGWFNNGVTGIDVPHENPGDETETTPELSSAALLLCGALPVTIAWRRRKRA